MKKANKNKAGRLLVHLNGWWVFGIIGGNMFLLEEYIPLFFLTLAGILGIIFYSCYYGTGTAICISSSLLISLLLFIQNPLHYEANAISQLKNTVIQGKISEIINTEYNQYLVLQDVSLIKGDEKKKLKTNIQVAADSSKELTSHDEVKMQATYREIEPQMNPSDFDYAGYLKGRNISSSFKMTSLIESQRKDPLSEKFIIFLKEQLNALYSPNKVGIMEACLLGDDSAIEAQTEELYNEAGIGHLLCISGFHVGLIMTGMVAILSLLGISYEWRFILAMIGIGGYTYLTGSSTSTLRAALMFGMMLMGRCCWQEEDTLTSLSLASWLILLCSPYQLFQAGFQLSFMAVLGITFVIGEIDKRERTGGMRYKTWQKSLIVTLAVQLAVFPVLSYHFYEVPFLISLVNLIVIPVFSIVIIMGWMSLILYSVHLPIGMMIAKGIELVLSLLGTIVNKLLEIPFATLCTGRLQSIELILFVLSVILVGSIYFKYIKAQTFYKSCLMIGLICMGTRIFLPKYLNIAMLYIGQGDGMVIETPHHQLIVIDGGNFGKGKVMESYIKYKGHKMVEAVFVSHSDADHIGGLIELLQTNVKVNKVFISNTDESDLLEQFLAICKDKGIQVYRLKKEDTVYLGDLTIKCLAPVKEYVYSEQNNNSMVLLLEYNQFKAVFTGDKEKDSDLGIYDAVGAVSLLKISHHGSRTGTSKELLLKLTPRYAMMSCGRNNGYGHPHREVLDLLEELQIPMSRTDKNGATWYETDGYYLTETTYRKDD